MCVFVVFFDTPLLEDVWLSSYLYNWVSVMIYIGINLKRENISSNMHKKYDRDPGWLGHTLARRCSEICTSTRKIIYQHKPYIVAEVSQHKRYTRAS